MSFESLFLLLLLASFLQVFADAQAELSFSLSDEKYVYAEKSFIQSCSVSEDVDVTRLKWLNPKNEHIGSSGRIYVEDGTKGQELVLIFKTVAHSDKGNYTCVATTTDGEISRIFKLQVLKPITFVNTPEIQTASEGSSDYLRCNVEGDPMPTIVWKPKSADWISHDRYIMDEVGFHIKNITRSDSGEYRCTAVQQSKEKTDFGERIIKFVVEYMPDWEVPIIEKVYSYITGTVNMTCRARGEPMPKFTWFRKEKPIVVEPSGQYAIMNSEGQSTLEIFIHDESGFGNYECVAENKMGSIKREIEVKLGAKPAKPEVNVKVYQPSSVELDIITDKEGELNLLSYRVQFKQNGQQWHDAQSLDFSVGSSYVIKGLKENTDYVLRVAAQNAAGLSDFTTDIPLRTVKMESGGVSDNSALSYGRVRTMDVVLGGAAAFVTFAVARLV